MGRHLGEISFDGRYVPVAAVAAATGKSPLTIRHAIESGDLPIGHCIKKGKRRNFYISPKLLYEETGLVARNGKIVGSERT